MRVFITIGYDEGQTVEQGTPLFGSLTLANAMECVDCADFAYVTVVETTITNFTPHYHTYHPTHSEPDLPDGTTRGYHD